jgi:hypothetical protein
MQIVETVGIKGTPVRSLLKFIETDLTDAQREKMFRALPPEIAERLRNPILATETIPVAVINTLTIEAARAKGEPAESFARRAGEYSGAEALSGVYRAFAMLLTPTALLSRAAAVWHSLYTEGVMHVEGETSSGARVILTDFPSHPIGCARVAGWLTGLAARCGTKNPRATHPTCIAKGGKQCEWLLSWDK